MSKLLFILSLVAVVIWLLFLWSRRKFYKVYWQMKGPLGLPFIGLGFEMMKPEKFLQCMQKNSEKYKTPFVSWMGTKCFLYVNDPETIETIFNSSHCTNKGDFYRFMATAIGDGLFTSSFPRWNKHRRLINPAFSRQVIQAFLPIFNKESNHLLSKLGKAQSQPLEIYEILKRSVLESACQTTMGKKLHSQSDGSAEIFDAYNGLTEVCVKRMLSPWLYTDVIYSYSSLYRRQQKYVTTLYKFVENLMHQNDNIKDLATSISQKTITKDSEKIANEKVMYEHHYENHLYTNNHNNWNVDVVDTTDDSNELNKKSKSYVFLEQIRNHIDEGQLTWQDVRDEANVIVAATFETTSTALYLVCLCLAMHPECQDKLYKELVDIFPSPTECSNNAGNSFVITQEEQLSRDGDSSLIFTDITLDQLERMKYTEMVINEAMRLFAPVPMVLRCASNEFQLRNGIAIPKGTQIGIDIYNMQRRKDIWGPLAHTFNPDKHFGACSKPHPFAFVPFTKGLRMCIGYRYAIMLMKVMLAKIFRNFRLTTYTNVNMGNIKVKGTISLKLVEYPLCQLQQRNLLCTNMNNKY